MIDALFPVQSSTLLAIQHLLRSLLQLQIVDSLLLPMSLPNDQITPMLVSNPDHLSLANPLAPVLPINTARAASLLTRSPHSHSLGLLLRSCEIRALVELVKFQQAHLDNVLIIGIDCLGTYSPSDWLAAPDKPEAGRHFNDAKAVITSLLTAAQDRLAGGVATVEPIDVTGVAAHAAARSCSPGR